MAESIKELIQEVLPSIMVDSDEDGYNDIHESVTDNYNRVKFIFNRHDVLDHSGYKNIKGLLQEELDMDDTAVFGLMITMEYGRCEVVRTKFNKPLLCVNINRQDTELRNNSLKLVVNMALEYISEYVETDKEKSQLIGTMVHFMKRMNDTVTMMNRCLTECNHLTSMIRQMRSDLMKDIERFKEDTSLAW